jgi:hypothetical protein
MKTTLVALTLCGFAMVAVSGCNKPEAAPAPAPTTGASQDASTEGQILRPSGGRGAGGTGPTGGIPSTYTAPPSNAPPGIQQQMQRMNGGFGNR